MSWLSSATLLHPQHFTQSGEDVVVCQFSWCTGWRIGRKKAFEGRRVRQKPTMPESTFHSRQKSLRQNWKTSSSHVCVCVYPSVKGIPELFKLKTEEYIPYAQKKEAFFCSLLNALLHSSKRKMKKKNWPQNAEFFWNVRTNFKQVGVGKEVWPRLRLCSRLS